MISVSDDTQILYLLYQQQNYIILYTMPLFYSTAYIHIAIINTILVRGNYIQDCDNYWPKIASKDSIYF